MADRGPGRSRSSQPRRSRRIACGSSWPVAISANRSSRARRQRESRGDPTGSRALAADEEGELLELVRGSRGVFTPFNSLENLSDADKIKQIEEPCGRVPRGRRAINRTPATRISPSNGWRRTGVLRLHDRPAVVTDVVLHTVDPTSKIPVVMRARMVRQFSQREYTSERRRSARALLTRRYSIGARTTYIVRARRRTP